MRAAVVETRRGPLRHPKVAPIRMKVPLCIRREPRVLQLGSDQREHREVEGAHDARVRRSVSVRHRPPGYVLLVQRRQPLDAVTVSGVELTSQRYPAGLRAEAAVPPDGVDEPAVHRARPRHTRAKSQPLRLAPNLRPRPAGVVPSVRRHEDSLRRSRAGPPHRARGQHRREVLGGWRLPREKILELLAPFLVKHPRGSSRFVANNRRRER